jgi:predicted AAA+ superfamily ATPase
MISRRISSLILSRLSRFPVVGLLGPRQIGKTTLTKDLLKSLKNSVYLDLELPSDLNLLRDPELYFRENLTRTIALDEIHHKPDLFPVMRSLIDIKRKAGRFLVTGSASPSVIQHGSETLAGRIIFCEMHPISLLEIMDDYKKLWLRGGFPDSYFAKSNRDSMEWRQGFVQTYIQRDIPSLGLSSNKTLLNRLLLMISSTQGSISNYSALSKSLGVSVTTVADYINILEETFILRRLPSFHTNLKKRIVKAPKIFIRDTGLLHLLWGIDNMNPLMGHHLVGHSWEGFVIQQIAANLKDDFSLFYYRTQDGAEVDLVIVKGNKPVVCLEIKFTDNPVLSKGNYIALTDLNAKHNFIVTPSAKDHAYDKKIRVFNISSVLKELEHLGFFI